MELLEFKWFFHHVQVNMFEMEKEKQRVFKFGQLSAICPSFLSGPIPREELKIFVKTLVQ